MIQDNGSLQTLREFPTNAVFDRTQYTAGGPYAQIFAPIAETGGREGWPTLARVNDADRNSNCRRANQTAVRISPPWGKSGPAPYSVEPISRESGRDGERPYIITPGAPLAPTDPILDHTLVSLHEFGDLADKAQVGDLGPINPAIPRIGRFIDLGVIGQGGLAIVHRVLEPKLRRTVALKILRHEISSRPDIRARFFAESQTTAQLQHPGIVPIYEAGRLADGRLYYTMREIHGETLHDAVNHAHGTAPMRRRPRQLIEAFRRVVEGVAYAHTRGVVHRDLKPENIMLGRFGEALVVDWGLAKVLGGVEPLDQEGAISVGTSMQTQWGHIMGTPKFMAPEQAAGALDEIGPHTDVYALGAILYLILSGKQPYNADTEREVLRRVVAGDYPPLKTPSRVPAYLRHACAKAMSRKWWERYPDAAALLAAVDPGQRTVSVAIRIGVQHDGRVEHAILPLGEGMNLGALRKRLGTRVLSSLRATTPLLSVSGDRVTVHCPEKTKGIVADERNSDDTFRLVPGSSKTVDAGAKGWLLLDSTKLLFQVGALDFDPQ